MFLIGFNALDLAIAWQRGLARVSNHFRGMQHAGHNHRLERMQFKIMSLSTIHQ